MKKGFEVVFLLRTVLLLCVTTTFLYAQAPDTLWTKIYTPGWVSDGVCVDSTDNIIITGDWLIVKYTPNGDIVWEKNYNFPGEGSQDIAIDQQDNIIITGQYDDDIMTIKCNSNGDTLWTRRYDSGSTTHDDHAFGVAVDTAGNIVVVGYIWGADLTWDIITIKYKPNGDTSWVKIYSDSVCGEQAYGVATDTEGNIIVTGWKQTIKYNTQGDTLWVRKYTNSISGLDVAVDTANNIIVAGTKLIKYTPNGDTIWTKDVDNTARSVEVYENGDFVTTGYTEPIVNNIVTTKYTSDGDTLWTAIYDSGLFDWGYGVTVDQEGHVIVTGGIYDSTFADFLTIKYDRAPGVEEEKTESVNDNNFGATIFNGSLLLPEGKNCKVFDITGRVVTPDKIKPGIYFIEIDGQFTKKVVKVR